MEKRSLFVLLQFYGAVGADDFGGGDIVVPLGAFADSFPLRNSTFKSDARQGRA
jgi:hypothetical protein